MMDKLEVYFCRESDTWVFIDPEKGRAISTWCFTGETEEDTKSLGEVIRRMQ